MARGKQKHRSGTSDPDVQKRQRISDTASKCRQRTLKQNKTHRGVAQLVAREVWEHAVPQKTKNQKNAENI